MYYIIDTLEQLRSEVEYDSYDSQQQEALDKSFKLIEEAQDVLLNAIKISDAKALKLKEYSDPFRPF